MGWVPFRGQCGLLDRGGGEGHRTQFQIGLSPFSVGLSKQGPHPMLHLFPCHASVRRGVVHGGFKHGAHSNPRAMPRYLPCITPASRCLTLRNSHPDLNRATADSAGFSAQTTPCCSNCQVEPMHNIAPSNSRAPFTMQATALAQRGLHCP